MANSFQSRARKRPLCPRCPHRNSAFSDTCDNSQYHDYVYDLAGHWLTEVNATGNACKGQIYAGARHLLTYAGDVFFNHQDWLGTERLEMDYTLYNGQHVSSHCTSLPFGDALSCTGGLSTLHFTGKERDFESGLDNFEARYFGSSLGRFMSADPDNLNGLIDQDDPQAWNGYAYARNNPLLYTDPGGTNYNVCDTNGKNCADLSDAQYDQFRKDNPDLQVTPSGDIYSGNTKIGSESYYNEKDVQAAQFLSGPIQNVVTKAGYVVGGAMAAVYAGAAYGTYQLGTTALNLAGAGAAAAPILYKTGDIIERIVDTPDGPVQVYGEVVVDGTNITIKDLAVYPAEAGERITVGTGNMLKALRPLIDELKSAGYSSLRILGDRSSAAGSANPGRPVDIFKTLR